MNAARALGLAALALLGAAPAPAYNLVNPPVKWPTIPHQFVVDSRGMASVSSPDPDHGVSAAVAAISGWNSGGVSPTTAVAGSVAYVSGDGRSDIIFDDPDDICTGNCLAVCSWSYRTRTSVCNGTTFYETADADIAFNLGYDWTTVAEAGCSGEFFLEAVVRHEVGHGLGLGHSSVSSAVMYASVSSCNNKAIAADDIAGRDRIYACAGSGGQADLVVGLLTVPASGGPGQLLTVGDRVDNVGTAAAVATVLDYWLSRDTVIAAGDTKLGSRNVPALAAGSSNSGGATLTIPAGTGTGTWYLIARADSTSVQAESSESNNTRAQAFTVTTAAPDLTVSSLSAPSSGGAGRALAVSDTVANGGSGGAGASLTRIYLSSNSSLDSSDVLLGSRSVPALAAGATSTGSTSVTIPAGTATGTWYLIAQADGGGTVAETNEANNLRSRTVRIGPDLRMNSTSAPASARRGTVIRISDTTANQGGGDAPASLTRFYLSVNGILDSGDVVLGGRSVPALGPNGLSSGFRDVTIPASTAPGTYYLFSKADGPDAVVETFENNNTQSRTITINP